LAIGALGAARLVSTPSSREAWLGIGIGSCLSVPRL
jgi:hypothetical protein